VPYADKDEVDDASHWETNSSVQSTISGKSIGVFIHTDYAINVSFRQACVNQKN
jgi:hypothetical protein